MNQNSRNDDWVGEILKTVLLWGWFVVAGLWIISQWLTRMLFQYVLNPLLDGALDKHDGLVVLASALLWGAVAGFVIFPSAILPELADASPAEVGHSFVIITGLGLVWGISIGFWLVLTWWTEIEAQVSLPDHTDITGLPRSFYEDKNKSDDDDDDDNWKGLILGVEAAEAA